MSLPEYAMAFNDNKAGLAHELGWMVKPMQSFVAAVGRRGALFVLSKGLYEYLQPRNDMLSVTLLRSVGEIFPCFSMYDTSAGQCPGRIALNYAVGLCGVATPAQLLKRAMEFRLPPLTFQTYGREPMNKMPAICAVSQKDWILSTIKQAEDGNGIVVRIFSLAAESRVGTLRLGVPFTRAFLARLDEKRVRELKIKNRTVRLELGARKIATVIFITD